MHKATTAWVQAVREALGMQLACLYRACGGAAFDSAIFHYPRDYQHESLSWRGLMLLMQKWCPLANVIPAGRTEQALRTEWLCLSSGCPVGIGGDGIKPTSYKHYCSEATPPVLPGSVWVRSVSLWPPMCSDPWKPLTLGSGTWTELSTGSGRYHHPAG